MSGLVFGIMSAIHSADTVRQLCKALASHQVVIHHDFSQQPNFSVDLPNVTFVPNPRQTGWNDFHFTEGVLHLLDYCVQQPSMEYFQLLTPTCLPIKPISTFEAFLADNTDMAHSEGIDLLSDTQALVNFGYRTFVPDRSLTSRALFRASEIYFGKDCAEQMQASLSVRTGAGANAQNKLIRMAHEWAANGIFHRHPFTSDWRPHMGSTWFGIRREAALWLMAQYREDPRVNFFRKVPFADELLFSTYLHNAPFEVGPAHHEIVAFDHARPRTLAATDLSRITNSEKFFARKFADDSTDQIRLEVLSMAAEPEPCLPAEQSSETPSVRRQARSTAGIGALGFGAIAVER